jgi:HK97 family phage portal protein
VTVNTSYDGELFYDVGTENTFYAAKLRSQPVTIPQEDMLHLRWMARDGICGISPITYAREAVGLAMAAEQHGAASFGNRATPGGVLKHPDTLSEEAAGRLRQQWKEKYQGPQNSAAPAVLEEGMEFQPFEISNEDRQFLETRRFQVEEIARIFRIPPHMIADLSRATFSNIESQSLDYVKNTLMAWLELWEGAIDRDLLRQSERDQGLTVSFDTARILRGTIKERFDAHKVAIESGIKTHNEVRLEEGLNPMDGGDTLLRPLNMAPVGAEFEGGANGDQAGSGNNE